MSGEGKERKEWFGFNGRKIVGFASYEKGKPMPRFEKATEVKLIVGQKRVEALCQRLIDQLQEQIDADRATAEYSANKLKVWAA